MRTNSRPDGQDGAIPYSCPRSNTSWCVLQADTMPACKATPSGQLWASLVTPMLAKGEEHLLCEQSVPQNLPRQHPQPQRKKTHFSTDCAFLMPSLACTSSSVRERAILKASVLAYRRCVLGSTYGASQPAAGGTSQAAEGGRSGIQFKDRPKGMAGDVLALRVWLRGALLRPFTQRLVLRLPAAGPDSNLSQPLLPPSLTTPHL